jgi:O-antigen/teichoic acid export membrane protein
LFRFGKWLVVSQILAYLVLHIDDAVVGRVVGVAALGLYQIAYTLSQVTTTEITAVVNQVAFPTYSKLQDQENRLGLAFLSTVQLIAFLSFPVAAGLWFIRQELVAAFLGNRWLPAVPALGVLLVWGLIRSISAATVPLLHGVGKPRQNAGVQLMQLVILAISVYPLTATYGIVGAAWSTVIAAVPPAAWSLRLAGAQTSIRGIDLGRILAIPCLSSLVMIAVLSGLRPILPSELAPLIWAPLLGAPVYAALILLARRVFAYRPISLPGVSVQPES